MKYAMCVADSYNLGAAYVMSHLKANGHEVKLIFDPRTGIDLMEYNLKQIEKFNPHYCLFSCNTSQYQWALNMAHAVKNRLGWECQIIFGGVHPTCCPEVVRENWFVDDVCIGDGIAYFGGTFKPDDTFPEREAFYAELPPRERRHPYIMTSFTCPFQCTYCLPQDKKLKLPRRSVASCIRELSYLKRLGAKRFTIFDDVFTMDKKWLECFLIRYKTEIGLPFRCVTHPKFIDDMVADDLAYAGCYMVAIGLQTGSERLRKTLNRHETNDEFRNACKHLKKQGIIVLVDHIFNLPHETEDSLLESYCLYKDVKPDMVNCFDLVYLPCTEIINTAIEAGIMKEQARYAIDRGLVSQFAKGASGIWVNCLLSVPLGHRWWALLPQFFIKVALYTKMLFKSRYDFVPLKIIQDAVHYFLKGVSKCLKLR